MCVASCRHNQAHMTQPFFQQNVKRKLAQTPHYQGLTVQKAANHTACPNTAKTRRESYLQLGMLEHAKQKLCGQPARGIPGQRGSKRLRQGQDAHPTAKPSSCGCPAKAMATDGHTSSPGRLYSYSRPGAVYLQGAHRPYPYYSARQGQQRLLHEGLRGLDALDKLDAAHLAA